MKVYKNEEGKIVIDGEGELVEVTLGANHLTDMFLFTDFRFTREGSDVVVRLVEPELGNQKP